MNVLDFETKKRALRMGINPKIVNNSNTSRLEELMDSRMIQEDERAIANAPQRVINREFYHCYDQPDSDAIQPDPRRNRRYTDNEDGHVYRSMFDEGAY